MKEQIQKLMDDIKFIERTKKEIMDVMDSSNDPDNCISGCSSDCGCSSNGGL